MVFNATKGTTYMVAVDGPERSISLSGPAAADTTPPAVNCEVPDQSVWYADEVTVACTSVDPGSGLADDADAAFTLVTDLGDGNESLNAQTGTRVVCDQNMPVANCSSVGPYTFSVDRKAPTGVSGIADRAPDSNGWYNAPVTMTFSGTDGGSGIANCTVETVSGPDGTALSVPGRCTDAVGNTSDEVSSPMFDLDTTAPEVTLTGTADGATYLYGSVPEPGCDAVDNLSGVVSGGDLDVSGGTSNGVGTFTASCTPPVDAAANTGAGAAATYTVRYADPQVRWPIKDDGSTVTPSNRPLRVTIDLPGGPAGGFDTSAWSVTAASVACTTGDHDGNARLDSSKRNTERFTFVRGASRYLYLADVSAATRGSCWRMILELDDATTFESAKFEIGRG